jgi:C4-dicarboxylate transporter DctM subunit
VLESTLATAHIFFVAVGAVIYSKYLTLSGMPVFMGDQLGALALDPILLVVASSVIYIILGMFLDPLGLLLLTLPVLLPMFEALDLDLVWIGVLVVKYLEIGLLTPPVGFNVYVIKKRGRRRNIPRNHFPGCHLVPGLQGGGGDAVDRLPPNLAVPARVHELIPTCTNKHSL